MRSQRKKNKFLTNNPDEPFQGKIGESIAVPTKMDQAKHECEYRKDLHDGHAVPHGNFANDEDEFKKKNGLGRARLAFH